jgi:hypothetical protein
MPSMLKVPAVVGAMGVAVLGGDPRGLIARAKKKSPPCSSAIPGAAW